MATNTRGFESQGDGSIDVSATPTTPTWADPNLNASAPPRPNFTPSIPTAPVAAPTEKVKLRRPDQIPKPSPEGAYDPYQQRLDATEVPIGLSEGTLGALQKQYADTLNTPGALAIQSGADRADLYNSNRAQQIEKAVSQPASPIEYQALQAGPDFQVSYESSTVQAVEMSSPLLRKLSPFMIQVEPPIAYGESGGFLARKGNEISINAFSTALQNSRGYDTARAALSQSTLAVGVNSSVNSVQEFVVANSNSNSKNGTRNNRASSPTKTSSIEQSKLGEPAIADLLQATDIAWQLSAIMQVPPLVLLINPQSLSVAYTKVQQFTDRTRYGFVFQAWGEEQPKLSITARCGAFISGGRGVQVASKRDSVAWQNLMNAFHFYRNNGYLYDTLGKSNAHHFIGALSIHYDQWIYYGHMENFGWSHGEENPQGGVEFTIEFTVSAMLDTAQQPFVVSPMRAPTPSLSDPRYQGLSSRAQNSPNEFSVGFSDDGTPRVSSQGRVVGVDAFGLLVPGSLEPVVQRAGWEKGVSTGGQPISYKGFQNSATGNLPGQRVVNVSAAQSATPFGLR